MRTGVDEARVPQVFDLPVAVTPCARLGRLQLTLRHGAKRSHGREQPNIGAGEFVGAVPQGDALPAAAAGQGETSREDIPRITAQGLARVRTATATAAQIARLVLPL